MDSTGKALNQTTATQEMKVFQEYHLPTTVNEALELLAQYAGRARVVAGGTDLLVDTQADYFHGARPHLDALVDVTRIEGANSIREEQGYIVISCGVTHTQIVESPLIQTRGTALAEASAVVGGPQVRNVATLCGNVAHALPAADGTVALLALGAEGQVARRTKDQGPKIEGERETSNVELGIKDKTGTGIALEWRPLAALFRGPGASAVDSTREVLTAVRFRPTGANEASAFVRVMRPQGVALPILGMAAQVRVHDSRLAKVMLSAGPVAPLPFRAFETEKFLRGKELTVQVLREAAEVLVAEAQPRTSPHRATREYRYELLPTLLEQTLRAAAARVKTA